MKKGMCSSKKKYNTVMYRDLQWTTGEGSVGLVWLEIALHFFFFCSLDDGWDWVGLGR